MSGASELEEFDTFDDLRVDAEKWSNCLNFPVAWSFYDETTHKLRDRPRR